MTGHAALARANFEMGCNCAQAVLCAYPELLPRETAMKLGASGFLIIPCPQKNHMHFLC